MSRCSRLGSVMCVLFAAFVSQQAAAWELQDKSLEEAVSDTPVVIMGKTATVINHYESEVPGVGSLWKLSLEVTKVIKGAVFSDTIIVTFASVEMAETSFEPDKEYLWLLQYPRNSSFFARGYENIYVTKNFASIYPTHWEDYVAEIVQYQSNTDALASSGI